MPDRLNISPLLALTVSVGGLLFGTHAPAQDLTAAKDAAYAAQAPLLAPDQYEDAESLGARAERLARSGAGGADEAMQEAIALFTTARDLAEQRARFLNPALTARDNALAAGANTRDNEYWEQAEEALRDAVDALERKRDEPARTNAEAARLNYDQAELQALQDRTLRTARERLIAADKLRAKRYAPVTLARGYELVNEARALLEQDRNARDEAKRLSARAAAYAERAIQITELARAKPSYEDIILAWERRLDAALQETELEPPVSLDPDLRSELLNEEIERLRIEEAALASQLADSQQFIAALEEEIRDLDEKLGGASAERRALIMQFEAQARAQEQLEQAKQTFTPDEAQVFTQSGDIVVRLIGLKFRSGAAALPPDSEELLQKLAGVIAIYPNSALTVEGHTDSQGSESGNLQLSQARADAVLNELVGKYRIGALRISAIGYGETRPVANNETNAGRERNRRIDLLITPAESSIEF